MASLNIVTAYIDLLGKSSELSAVRERDSMVKNKKTPPQKPLKDLQVKTTTAKTVQCYSSL